MAIQFLNSPLYGDNVKIEFGNSADLQIYHDASHSYINNSTGDLTISNTGDDLILKSADDFLLYVQGTELAIQAVGNGGVILRHNNVVKFETTSSGVTVTGDILIEDSSPQIHFLDTTNNTDAYIYSDDHGSLNIAADENNENNFSKVRFYIDGSEKVRIVSSGSVGIGETSVDARLHITTATAGLVNQKFESAGSAAWRLGIPASQTYFAFDNANDNLSAPKLVINNSGFVGIGSTSPVAPLEVKSSEQNHLTLYRPTNTTEGIAGNINFDGNDSDSNQQTYAKISSFTDDPTAGSIAGKLRFSIAKGAEGMTSAMTIQKDAQVSLNQYGQGSYTGTAAYTLQVDSAGNIIEGSTTGGGTVTGSGTATRVAFWSGTTALSSDANLYWDNTNDRLGIGTTSPSFKTQLYDSGNTVLGITAGVDNYAALQFGRTSDATRGAIEFYTGDDSLRLKTGNNAEKMRITSAGNVGIGNTSPNATLEIGTPSGVGGSSGSVNRLFISPFSNTGGPYKFIARTVSGSSDFLDMYYGSNHIISYSLNGNVGIGTTAPTTKLSVDGGESTFNRGNSAGTIATFRGQNAAKAVIGTATSYFTSNVGIGTTSPDTKLEVVNDVNNSSNTGTDGNANLILSNSNASGTAVLKLRGTGSNSGAIVFGQSTGASTDKFNIIARYNHTKILTVGADGNSTFAGSLDVGNFTFSGSGIVADAGMTLQTGGGSVNAITLASGGDATFAGNVKATRFQGSTYPSNSILGSGTDATTTTIVAGSTANLVTSIDLAGSGATNPKTIIFKTLSAERMRIDSSGNVGIGTTSIPNPFSGAYNNILQVGTTSGHTRLVLTSGTSSSCDLAFADSNSATANGSTVGSISYKHATDSMLFATANAERMRIDSSGNVGIGTTNPNRLLTIAKGHSDTRMRMFYDNTDDTKKAFIDFWASEPGVTYNGSGIGANINGNPYYGRYISGQGQTYIRFLNGEFQIWTGASASGTSSTATRRLTVGSDGDVGSGTIPETAGSTWRSLFVGSSLAFISRQSTTGTDSILANNYYINSSNVDKKRVTGGSSRLFLDSDVIRFQNSGTANADTTITWSERMRIDGNGDVGIGTTDPVPKLHLVYPNGSYGVDATSGFINQASSGRSTTRLRSIANTASELFFDVNGAARWDISARGSGSSYSLNFYPGASTPAYNAVGAHSLQLSQNGDVIVTGSGSSGNMGIGTTAPGERLEVNGLIKSRKGIFNDKGVYTAGGTHTNKWQKFATVSYSSFSYSAFKLLIQIKGDTGNVNTNAEVDISYKFQNNNGKLYANIRNYGSHPLPASSFEIYRNGTSSSGTLSFYIYIDRNYSEPVYSVIGTGNLIFSSSVIGTSLSGETNDAWTTKTILNTLTIDADDGKVGIGTTAPASELEVAGIIRSAHAAQRYAALESNSSGGVVKGVGGNGFLVRSYGDSYFNGGDFGIGLTSPTTRLSLSGSQTALDLTRGTTGDSKWGLSSDSTALYIAELSTGSTDYIMTFKETSGNVGIGTTAPSSLLHLSSASSPTLRIVDTTNDVTLLAFSQDSSAGFGTFSAHQLNFYVNSSTAMVIDGSQNVGIGLTADVGKLGTVNFGGVRLHIRGSGNIARAALEGTVQATVLMRVSGSTASANSKIKFIQSKGGEYRMGSVDDNGTERTQLSIENNGDTHIEDGSLEVDTADKGLILKSANGNRFRITVDNGGTLTSTQIG